jgi:hypothetical protein
VPAPCGRAAVQHEARGELRPIYARAEQREHFGGGPAVERRRLHRDQHEVGREQRRAHQPGNARWTVDDDVVGVAGQLRRFTVERVAGQAHDTEQPLQPFPAALLRPVERRTLRVGVYQRDAVHGEPIHQPGGARAWFFRLRLSG